MDVVTVFVVISQHWEDAAVEGVYDSLESAQAQHTPPVGGTWYETDNGAFQTGLAHGWSVTIERFDMKITT